MTRRVVQDVRLALRGFRCAPAFAAAVVATLALGIGVSTAIFTTAETVLARRLQVADQERLAVLWTHDAAGTELPPESTTLLELRASSRTVRETTGAVYSPWRQNGWPGTLLAVRTTLDPPALTAALRRVMREVGPALTLWRVESLDDALGEPLAEPRMSAVLFGGFALAALALAAVGLFGVVASGVRERAREIGVRMALGATPARVRGDVLRGASGIVAVGVLVGLATALAATRLLRALLFEVSPADPAALGAACGVLLAAALVAAFLPARRATSIDPARTLRAD